jgi:outer membrane protein OmpA-like peptidoglycan-associated protein
MASLLMAQKNVVFREDFDNNNNSWSTGFTQGTGAIADGVYTVDKTSGDGNFYFYKTQAYEPDKDYTVEASIRQADDKWSKAQDISQPLNNIRYNFVIGVTPDGNTSYIGNTIRLNNVFFDFARFTLRPQSHAELNRLIEFLQGHPTMTIELGGHTDNVGDETTNMKLSQNRVNAVKEYLVATGIDASRLVAKGYGKSRPRADNKTEEGRQTNRRVEFIFLKQ